MAFIDPGAFFPVLAPTTVFDVATVVPDPPTIPLPAEAVNDIALESFDALVALESEVRSET